MDISSRWTSNHERLGRDRSRELQRLMSAFLTMKQHSTATICGLSCIAFATAACSDSEIETVDELIDQAEVSNSAEEKNEPFEGLWRTEATVTVPGTTAFIDLIWIVGEQEAWHVVSVFADPQMTIPLARWDIVRGYELGEPFSISPDARELLWDDRQSWVSVFTDQLEILAVLGLDDCNATVGVPRDTSTDNCAAPFFPFRTCPMMDFAEINENGLTFGDPQAVDRCVQRVDEYEAWTFERTTMTAELADILEQRPEALSLERTTSPAP